MFTKNKKSKQSSLLNQVPSKLKPTAYKNLNRLN